MTAMKTNALACALTVALASLAGTLGAEELFNGRDLSGWYTWIRGRGRDADPKAVFTVRDGALHVSGEEMGAVVTEREFSDYELEVEYRFLGGEQFCGKQGKAPDSGVLFHSTGPDGGFGGIWMESLEANLIVGATGDFWGVGARGKDTVALSAKVGGETLGGKYRIHDPSGAGVYTIVGNNRVCRFDIARDWKDEVGVAPAANERPVGEWNLLKLVCDGDKVQVWLNGKLVNSGFGAKPTRGRIQLQSEGCAIEFRRVTVRDLRPALVPPQGDATAVVQGAIDAAFRAGGGTVRLGKGKWNVKALRLRSHVTLYLESGAEVAGSRNIDDYFILDDDKVEPVPRSWLSREAWELEHSCSKDNFTRSPASRWNNGLIRVLNATDAAIVGESGSVIDGRDPYDPLGEEQYRGPHGVSAINCANLVLRGYTIRNAGNWAHRIADTRNLVVDGVTCLAGHDGVHVNGCDGVRIVNCTMKTGDDCVAGFDNTGVVVRDCYLNTACSGFRFAGTGVLIEKCTLKGPAEYGFRGSLSKEDKAAGAPSGKAKRHNMLSFFTYYADGTHPVRSNAGGIVIRDCVSHGTDRYLHYNYGNERWQRGKPMTDITFERVRATGLKLPISAWGDRETPVRLRFKDCELGYDTAVRSLVIGSFVGGIEIDGLKVQGVDGPLLRLWNADAVKPALKVNGLEGVPAEVRPENGPWQVRGI